MVFACNFVVFFFKFNVLSEAYYPAVYPSRFLFLVCSMVFILLLLKALKIKSDGYITGIRANPHHCTLKLFIKSSQTINNTLMIYTVEVRNQQPAGWILPTCSLYRIAWCWYTFIFKEYLSFVANFKTLGSRYDSLDFLLS